MQEYDFRGSGLSQYDSATARLTIDLRGVAANWRLLAKLSGSARCSAVVKADAYGLGAIEIGNMLYKTGCRDFFVATAKEGTELRSVAPEARIFVLAGYWPGMDIDVFGSHLVPVLASYEQIASFRQAGKVGHPYALFVDTGMNRLGLTPAEAMDIARQQGPLPELVMSHLACSDDAGHPMNHRQCESFRAVSHAFEGVESSLASSGGILLGADYHFDLTRPGIALYGGQAVCDVKSPTRPVVTAEARILQIRDVPKGEAASYGATHVFERDSRIAIVAAGYADGWFRSMSGSGVAARADGSRGGVVMIAGQNAPLIGRMTMDLATVDISHIPPSHVRTGDYAELFGHANSMEDAASSAGTINHELLTSIGRRYARRYV